MPTSVREPLLAIRELSAGYGKIGVLKSVDMVVYPGEIVAMLGPNCWQDDAAQGHLRPAALVWPDHFRR